MLSSPLLADEASLRNVLQGSDPPAHLLCPVELETNSDGAREDVSQRQSERSIHQVLLYQVRQI